MVRLVISKDAGSEDLAPLALAINQIVGLPITLRSARFPGVRVERVGFWTKTTAALFWKRS